MLRVLLPAVFLLCACGDPRTRPVDDEATVSPGSVDFGPVFVGARADRSFEIQLHSRAPAGLLAEADPPFSVERTSLQLAAGSTTTLSVHFTPTAVGAASSELRLSVAGKDYRVSLAGVGLPPLACESSSFCVEARFDPQAGHCVEAPAREGESCSNECLQNASCSAGSCVGSAVDCEDGDACTVDACSPQTGCLQLPRDCGEESDNVCRSGVCVPGEGCVSVVAPEGTPCGEGRTCELGECVWRPLTPETVCAMETPCQPAGVWSDGACVRDAPVPLTSRWSWSGGISDGMVVDGQGNLYWSENDYDTWTAELISLAPDGTLRFRQPLGKPRARPKFVRDGLLFQLEYDPSGDYVAARSTHTGALKWKRNFTAALGLGDGAMHSSLVPAPGDELRLLAHADPNEPPMHLLSVGQESGELRNSQRMDADGELQRVDEQGRSLLSLYSAGYQKAVHDRTGRLLWSDADSESRVDPFRFGVSLREDGRLERSEDGTLIAQLPTARAQLGYSELNPRFLVRGAAILLGRPLASGETWESSKRQPATHVFLQPFPTGALQMYPVGDGRPFLPTSEVQLTSRGGLLYVEVNLAGGLRLREVRVTGEVLYECPLVAPSRLSCCLTPSLGKTQLLLDERWIVAPADGGVYSFDLKGVFPAASP